MSIPKLIMQFAMKETLPVQVEEVVTALRALGVDEGINFFHVQMDAGVLKGEIEQYVIVKPDVVLRTST